MFRVNNSSVPTVSPVPKERHGMDNRTNCLFMRQAENENQSFVLSLLVLELLRDDRVG